MFSAYIVAFSLTLEIIYGVKNIKGIIGIFSII